MSKCDELKRVKQFEMSRVGSFTVYTNGGSSVYFVITELVTTDDKGRE